MAITLKTDNRSLLTGAKYSYLNANYASGVTTLVLVSGTGFAANDYILLGEFGQETAEIVKISNVSTNTLTVGATSFAHAESTKVTILKYNQVRFYHTADTTFSAGSPVTAYMPVQADSRYTIAYDTTNTTGYGWSLFYNATTAKATQNSNAIPYAGFGQNSVKKLLDAFWSQLNSKETNLITVDDAFYWLNEGYSIAKSELNLVNNNYSTAERYSLTTTSGLQEYSFPTNASKIMAVYDSDEYEQEVEYIEQSQIDEYESNEGNRVKYYIRGDYIGFTPTPDSAATYYVRYQTKASTLTSYYDDVELPDNNYFCIIDFMLYRASQKLGKNDIRVRKSSFDEGLERLKLTSFKRHGEEDSFGIKDNSNV